jgi:hypothetical protein
MAAQPYNRACTSASRMTCASDRAVTAPKRPVDPTLLLRIVVESFFKNTRHGSANKEAIPFNADILRWAREWRGRSVDEVANRLKQPADKIGVLCARRRRTRRCRRGEEKRSVATKCSAQKAADRFACIAFINFLRNLVTSRPCERNRSLRIDRKDRPRTDSR